MQIKKRPLPVLSSDGLVLFSSSYSFLVNSALIAAIKSAKVFSLTANQKIADPPIPATATEPIRYLQSLRRKVRPFYQASE